MKNFLEKITLTQGIFAVVMLFAIALSFIASPLLGFDNPEFFTAVAAVPGVFANNALQKELAQKLGVSESTVQQSRLRRCITLTSGTPTGNYDVKFNITQSSDASDMLLDQNDLFLATSIRIGIAARLTAKPSAFVTQTYANEIAFGATGANVASVLDLQAIWQGQFFVKTGQTITRKFSTNECYLVPQTQQSQVTNRVQRDPKDGFYHFVPRYFFFGGGDQFINVNFDTTGLASFVGTGSYFTSLVVELNGLVVYNMDPKNSGAAALLKKGYL